MRDIAYNESYYFTATLDNGARFQDLFTIKALGATDLPTAKRYFAHYAEKQTGQRVWGAVTATLSSERFA